MFEITIAEKGGPAKNLEFDKNEVTIGRIQGNDVVLPKGNISKRHSRIVLKDGKFIIIDMQSTNGTYVNGKKITTPQVIKSTDKIYIGDFTLQLTPANGAADAKGAGARSKPAAPKEDDFGGELELDAGSGSPNLLDNNLDADFDAPEAKSAPKASPPRKRAEPEPEPPSQEQGLDLEMGESEAAPPSDEGELDLEAEAPRAPVVPLKKDNKKPEPDKRLPAPLAISKQTPASAGPSRVAPKSRLGAPLPAKKEEALALPPPVEMQSIPSGSGGQVATFAPMAMAAPAAELLDRNEAIQKIQLLVVRELGLRGYDLIELEGHRDAILKAARGQAQRFKTSGKLAANEDSAALGQAVADEILDFSAISELIQDGNTHEIVITHQGQIYAERDGRLEEVGKLEREDDIVRLIRRLAMLGGAEASATKPLVDVRLRDGSRVVATLPPLAFRGPTLSYRKSTREAFALKDLIPHGTLSEPMLQLIDYGTRYHRGILLSVGPGVGASATLNALGSLIPVDERIATVESGVELNLGHNNVTALEPSEELGVTALIRHAVTMQPDRALIGVISGTDVHEVLSAMSGPLEGAICCYAAMSPEHAIDRMARVDLAEVCPSLAEARRLVASAITLVLQEERLSDNSRRITKISEVWSEGDEVRIEDIFRFEPEGLDEKAMITGSFKATGVEPRFLGELHDRDQIDMSIFEA